MAGENKGVKVQVVNASKVSESPKKKASNVEALSDDIFGDLDDDLSEELGSTGSMVVSEGVDDEGSTDTVTISTQSEDTEFVEEVADLGSEGEGTDSQPQNENTNDGEEDDLIQATNESDQEELEGLDLGEEFDPSLLEEDDEEDEKPKAKKSKEMAVDNTSDGEGEEASIGFFTIYNANCMRCTHLCPELEAKGKGKAFKDCHYSRGNEDCPAQTAQIVIGIPIEKIAKNIVRYKQEQNSAKLAHVYSKLATKDDAQQHLVYQRVKELESQDVDVDE
jgi:hypothetical protein